MGIDEVEPAPVAVGGVEEGPGVCVGVRDTEGLVAIMVVGAGLEGAGVFMGVGEDGAQPSAAAVVDTEIEDVGAWMGVRDAKGSTAIVIVEPVMEGAGISVGEAENDVNSSAAVVVEPEVEALVVCVGVLEDKAEVP